MTKPVLWIKREFGYTCMIENRQFRITRAINVLLHNIHHKCLTCLLIPLASLRDLCASLAMAKKPLIIMIKKLI